MPGPLSKLQRLQRVRKLRGLISKKKEKANKVEAAMKRSKNALALSFRCMRWIDQIFLCLLRMQTFKMAFTIRMLIGQMHHLIHHQLYRKKFWFTKFVINIGDKYWEHTSCRDREGPNTSCLNIFCLGLGSSWFTYMAAKPIICFYSYNPLCQGCPKKVPESRSPCSVAKTCTYGSVCCCGKCHPR